MNAQDKARAAEEATIQAVATLEACGAPLPPEGPDRVRVLERVLDTLAAIVDELPED